MLFQNQTQAFGLEEELGFAQSFKEHPLWVKVVGKGLPQALSLEGLLPLD